MTCLSALGYWKCLLWLTLSLRRCLGSTGRPTQSRGRSSRISPSDYRPTYENFKIIHRGRTRTQTYQRGTWGGGRGRWEISPLEVLLFWSILEYSETILPSGESLWSSLQDKVYFMSGVAAGGLWRNRGRHLGFHQGLEIRVKQQVMVIFCLRWKITHK